MYYYNSKYESADIYHPSACLRRKRHYFNRNAGEWYDASASDNDTAIIRHNAEKATDLSSYQFQYYGF